MNCNWDDVVKSSGSVFPLHFLAVQQKFKLIIELFTLKQVSKLQMN